MDTSEDTSTNTSTLPPTVGETDFSSSTFANLPTQRVYVQSAAPNITTSPIHDNNTSSTGTLKLATNLSNPLSNPLPLSQQNVILSYSNPIQKHQQIVLQNPNTLQTVPLPITIPPKNPLTYLTQINNKTTQQYGIAKNKFVLSPMPKLTTNRLAATVTTNSLQSKYSIQPYLTENSNFLNTSSSSSSMMNVKIANGIIQSDKTGAITVMCSNIPNDYNQTDYDDEIKLKSELNTLSLVNNSSVSSENLLQVGCSETSVKDTNKNPKHGISILKKNFNIETKSEKTHLNNHTNNPLTTISDGNDVKEKEIISKTTENTSKEEAPVINTPTVPKSGRRRKSHFACKQDYDEIVFTESNIIEKSPHRKENNKFGDCGKQREGLQLVMEKFSIKPDINMNEDLEKVNDLLIWDDGIGSLPGSDIKFMYNKYKFLQLLKKEEYIEIMNKRASKSKLADGTLEEMCCLQCGCYGLPSEFITSKYCSNDCRDISVKAIKLKDRNLRLRAYNCFRKSKEAVSTAATSADAITPISEVKSDKEKSDVPSNGSEEENTSNENSQDKYSFPWNCSKKGFSWPKYLEHIKAKAAPVKLFKDPFPYNRNGFRPGMKLEGIDPQHPSYFCVLTVVEVVGYRIRLHFDGYSDNYDFWTNADSMDIFPAGWCEKYGHELRPPPSYKNRDFNWTAYMKNTRCILAPKHLFADRGGSALCPNGFRIGMKLEAVDRKNTSLVCVATVMDMMDNRLLIHFDSWDDIYDYWTDPTSPFIHPVGWADKNGHSLTPPNNYQNPETFTWEGYLKEKKFVAAPARAFKQRPTCGFKRGMRLECVDKRVPRLIRAATVDDIKDHQMRISFDGWPDRYSYWVDSDNTDIHPVGWCQKTGHPIEPPLTPADVYDFLECPTVGCRGQGHIQGAKNTTHSLPSECPYSDENINKEHVLPDRLLSPDRQLESVVPVSREPREKSKKTSKTRRSYKREFSDYDIGNGMENGDTPHNKKIKSESDEENGKIATPLPLTNGYINEDLEQIWEIHSKFLIPHIKSSSNPELWTKSDVVQFISSMPGCDKCSSAFEEQNIDGSAFLMLSQRDLTELLNIKLGPAIKIYSIIILLRRYCYS